MSRDPRVDTQVWTAARDLSNAERGKPAWLWYSDVTGATTYGRWARHPGQVPYVRADIALGTLAAGRDDEGGSGRSLSGPAEQGSATPAPSLPATAGERLAEAFAEAVESLSDQGFEDREPIWESAAAMGLTAGDIRLAAKAFAPSASQPSASGEDRFHECPAPVAADQHVAVNTSGQGGVIDRPVLGSITPPASQPGASPGAGSGDEVEALTAENVRLREALASDARVEAILTAILTPRGDPEDGTRDHLPRVLRDFLSEACGKAGLVGFEDGYAEGLAKATPSLTSPRESSKVGEEEIAEAIGDHVFASDRDIQAAARAVLALLAKATPSPTPGAGEDAGGAPAGEGSGAIGAAEIDAVLGRVFTAFLSASYNYKPRVGVVLTPELRANLRYTLVAHLRESDPTPPAHPERVNEGFSREEVRALIRADRARCVKACLDRAAYFDQAPGHRSWADAGVSYRATAEQIRTLPYGQVPAHPERVTQGAETERHELIERLCRRASAVVEYDGTGASFVDLLIRLEVAVRKVRALAPSDPSGREPEGGTR